VKPRYRFGPLTAVTVVLLGLFGVVDYVAHATGYTHGATFSALVWHLSPSPGCSASAPQARSSSSSST
jgi:hypothetical protein